jgi:hypothetical protein
MTIEVVISNAGSVLGTAPVSWEWFLATVVAFLSYIITLLILSYKYGYKKGYIKGLSVGKQRGFRRGYKSGKIKGNNQGFKDGLKKGFDKGFDKGKADYYNTTIKNENIICIHNPTKQYLLNGIVLTTKANGDFIDIQCPLLGNDKICQTTNKPCEKIF